MGLYEKISKDLKNANFEYDEETKSFLIKDKSGNVIELNKVYAFAFMRFVVRMAQRNWLRQKTNKVHSQKIIENEQELDNPDQMVIFE